MKLCLLAGSFNSHDWDMGSFFHTILKFVYFITCSEKLKSSILRYNKLKTYSTYYLLIEIKIITALSSKDYIKIHKYFIRFELKAVIIPIYFCNSKVSEDVFILLFTDKITAINQGWWFFWKKPETNGFFIKTQKKPGFYWF